MLFADPDEPAGEGFVFSHLRGYIEPIRRVDADKTNLVVDWV